MRYIIIIIQFTNIGVEQRASSEKITKIGIYLVFMTNGNNFVKKIKWYGVYALSRGKSAKGNNG